MLRLGTVGLCTFVLAILVGTSRGAEPANPGAELKAEFVRPIDVAAPAEARERAKIMKALDEETAFDFTQMPLSDVVMYLKDKHKIEIQLDTKALEDGSIGLDTEVTRNLSGISLRSALQLMLGAMDLTYTIKDEVLMITRADVADKELIVRIYPVGDLIAADAADKPGQQFAPLVEVIKGTIGHHLWQEKKGVGSIEPWALGQALVIGQTSAVHEQIEPLLTGLRGARDVAARHGGNKAEARGYAKIMKALDEETKLDFTQMPLSDVVMYLKDKYKIEIQLDTRALEDASIGLDTEVTRSLSGLSLRSALQLMLGAMDLTYTIKDEVLMITTPAMADKELIVRIYPVGDLIAADAADTPGQQFAPLVEVIKGTIGHHCWQEKEGVGNIEPWALGQALVIGQTTAVHEQIEPLLAGLRQARDVAARHGGNKVVVSQ